MDHLRRRGREIAIEDFNIGYEALAAKNLIVETTPRSQLERFERYRSLHSAIKKLKIRYQIVIMLHYFEQKTYEEIAGILNCRAATVRWRLHRARKQLARLLISPERGSRP